MRRQPFADKPNAAIAAIVQLLSRDTADICKGIKRRPSADGLPMD